MAPKLMRRKLIIARLTTSARLCRANPVLQYDIQWSQPCPALAPVSKTLESIKSTIDAQSQHITKMKALLSDQAWRTGCPLQIVEIDRWKMKHEDSGNPWEDGRIRPGEIYDHIFNERFGVNFFSPPLSLDRAQWLGRVAEDGGSNRGPRPFFVRFHHYQQKELVMTKRRQDLTFRGHKTLFFPDLSGNLGRHAAFNNVKASLCKRNVHFSLLHPAQLVVYINNQVFLFDTPNEVYAFYDDWWGNYTPYQMKRIERVCLRSLCMRHFRLWALGLQLP